MQDKSLFGGRFVLLEKVAVPGGMSGSVFRALDIESRTDCAIKRFTSKEDALGRLAIDREVSALSKLIHPHVVRMFAWGKDEATSETWIAEEWLAEDLESHCRNRPFDSFHDFYERVGRPILDALSVAYAREIIHRDIKPQNIMFDGEGVPKLIDFGISGRTSDIKFGKTLQDFKSVPFSPPESGLGSAHDETRDVFGFAAIVVYALTGGGRLESYEDLQSRFKAVASPQEIKDLLGACLATDPEDRPPNIVVARASFEQVCPHRTSDISPAHVHKIGLTIGPGVLSHARRLMGEEESLASICEMLNGDTRYEQSATDDLGVRAVTPEFTVKLVHNERNPSCLFVTGVFDTRPAHWAQVSVSGYRGQFEYIAVEGNAVVADGDKAIELLMQSVEEHQAQLSSMKKSVIDGWRTILRGRIDIAREQHPRIIADVIRREGSRLFVKTSSEVDGIEGLHYLVGDGIEKIAACEVERASEGQLTLYSAAQLPPNVPSTVVLSFNSVGTEASIKREERAINLIQDGDTPLPSLRGIIEDPSVTKTPSSMQVDPILPNIDDDKRRAVEAALGCQEVMLLIGPPGTGKTQFIAELVLQEVKRNPAARLLLAAQTHIAVDNALQRIRDASPTTRCVRVGAIGDERISEASRQILLDSTVGEWVRRVTHASNKAVAAMCEDSSVDYDGLLWAVKHKQLGRKTALRDQLVSRVDERARKIDGVAASIDDAKEAPWRTELARLQNEQIADKELLRLANLAVEEAEAEIANLSRRDFNDALVKSESEAEVTAIRVVELQQEWISRLANPTEHYPAVLMDASVVAGTCVGFVGARGASQLTFDLAIIDEASRAAPTEVLVAASRASRIVLVGDRKQLPAYLERGLLDSDWLDSCGLSKAEVRETLFERFEAFLPKQNVKRLQNQYRMLPSIGRLVERCFYPGQLDHPLGDSAFDLKLTDFGVPRNVILLSTSSSGGMAEVPSGTGFENTAEVTLCEKILRKILANQRGVARAPSMVVLTPYVAQQKLLRRCVDQLLSEYPDSRIEVHTVHGFQGREADFAVVSLVRSNVSGEMGFVNDDQLINVAVSRGRSGLILVGDLSFLSKQPPNSAIGRVVTHIRDNADDCSILGLRQ